MFAVPKILAIACIARSRHWLKANSSRFRPRPFTLWLPAPNAAAVARLIAAKRAPSDQGILTLGIKSSCEALDYVPQMSPLGQRLGAAAVGRALSRWSVPIIIPKACSLVSRPAVRQALRPSGNIGLSVPWHPMFLDTLKMIVGPVAMTSAAPAGQPDPLTAQEVVASLGDDVALVSTTAALASDNRLQ